MPASGATSVRPRRQGEDSAWLASAASTGTPTTLASTPGGGSRRLYVVHQLLLALERHQSVEATR